MFIQLWSLTSYLLHDERNSGNYKIQSENSVMQQTAHCVSKNTVDFKMEKWKLPKLIN